MSEWYIVYNGQQIGPMTKQQLRAYNLNMQSKVWRDGMPDWVDAFSVPELMEMIQETQTQQGASVPAVCAPGCATPEPARELSGKSKVVCGVLALLLGWLGVQYFYINKPVGGVMSILVFILVWTIPTVLTIVTCGTGAFLYSLSAIVSIIPFAQGIEMFCLSDEDFDSRFVYSSSSWPIF